MKTNEPTPRKPLRLWPGVVAAVLLAGVRFGIPLVVPDAGMLALKKTLNHPVVVGDVLLVRNGEEMAAFRLPVGNR